jgi:hypothetical protein
MGMWEFMIVGYLPFLKDIRVHLLSLLLLEPFSVWYVSKEAKRTLQLLSNTL